MMHRMVVYWLVTGVVCYAWGMELQVVQQAALPEPFCSIQKGERESLAEWVKLKPELANSTYDVGTVLHTPLTYALEQHGKAIDATSEGSLVYDLVAILLAAKADPNKGSDRKPIHYAAGLGLKPVVELLYKCKADLCALDAHQATALHYVAGCDILLLRCNAPLRKKNSSVVLRSVSPGVLESVPPLPSRSEIMERSAERLRSNGSAENVARALEDALRLEIALLLLAAGVHGDAVDKAKKTAWDYASQFGFEKLKDCFVKKPE